MSANRSGATADDHGGGTWASETLPLSVRKELLERELSKLGFRKGGAQGGSSSSDAAASQSHGDAGSSHPKADSAAGTEHAD